MGDDSEPLRSSESICAQRHVYGVQKDSKFYPPEFLGYYSRFMHIGIRDFSYTTGKHTFSHPYKIWNGRSPAVIMKFSWSPWPESIHK